MHDVIQIYDGFQEWAEIPNEMLLQSHNVYNVELVAEMNRALHVKVYEEALKERFVLTVGGDHSLSMGSVAGVRRRYPDLAVLWIDAHAVKY